MGEESTLDIILVTTLPFGKYGKGDRIETADTDAVLRSEHAGNVVAVTQRLKPSEMQKGG